MSEKLRSFVSEYKPHCFVGGFLGSPLGVLVVETLQKRSPTLEEFVTCGVLVGIVATLYVPFAEGKYELRQSPHPPLLEYVNIGLATWAGVVAGAAAYYGIQNLLS